MKWGRSVLVVMLGLVFCPGAFAMFRAADLVVVPVAAANPGLNSSIWRSDVEIINVDSVAIDVEIVFLPTGGNDNTTWFNTIANHLGGRTEDGFGHIDDKLKDIPAGRAVTIEDIIKPNWGDNQKGALLIFAYEAGTLMKTTPPGGNPKNILVNTRSYDVVTDASGNTSTFGQQIPGLPWYDYIDPSKKSRGLDHVVFTGIREDAAYRTAVGMVNVSDRLTELEVRFTLTGADGTLLDEQTLDMVPLMHAQYDNAAHTLFTVPTGTDVVGATMKVTVDSYYTTAAAPAPALMVYVSRVDNTTNDPIYLEQTFDKPFPWDCIFNGNCTSASALQLSTQPLSPRHLRPPTRHLH